MPGRSIFKRAKASGSDIAQSADAGKTSQQQQQPLNKYDERVLVAAEKGDLSGLKSAAKKGGSFVKLSTEGLAAIHFSCHHGHMQLAEYMIQHDPGCVMGKDKQGRTPIHHASRSGHLLCLQLLMQGHTSPDLLCEVDGMGMAPLHYAAYGHHLSVVKYLLERECPVSQQDENGLTPLLYACATDGAPVAQILLDSGADVNSTNDDNRTPLMLASEKGFTKIVDLLLRHGAKTDLVDSSQNTAADLAVRNGFDSIKAQIAAQPPMASWQLGVKPGSENRAVVTTGGTGFNKTVSDTSLMSDVVPTSGAAASAPRKLVVTDRSIKDRNVPDGKGLKAAAHLSRVADGSEDDEGEDGWKEQVQDLTIQLSQVRRELRREADQRKKTEDEVQTLKGQLESFRAEDSDEKQKDSELDFSDDNEEDTLPDVGGARKADGAGAFGLIKAQQMIKQLREELDAAKGEQDSSQEVQSLRAEVKQLQYEKSVLADKLDDSDTESQAVPTVPLAAYQNLKESQEEILSNVQKQLAAARQELEERERENAASSPILEAEITSLRDKLSNQDEEHNRVIQLYRHHILAAANGYIHPSVQDKLAAIARLRQTSSP
eukprot:scpid40220/ scgid2662/ Ankycorbin; Ankyrin repeat and coiled-coil structure-containing protein; Novel retinal pigment epithelial cell protein; Retinoic acid-induced protein 14; p125